MRSRRFRAAAAGMIALLTGCATQPDHFYTLDTLPGTAGAASAPPARRVLLDTTIPVLDDRAELVVGDGGNRVAVLDHERWAAPLSDLVRQTLARDIERRRPDILVADRRFDRPALPTVSIKVDIVRMRADPGQRVSIDAHWRVVDPHGGIDLLGSGSYEAPLAGTGYAPVALAYSVALGALADALTARLPAP